MAIKDYYDIYYIKRISEQMAAVYPEFPRDSFMAKMEAELDDKIRAIDDKKIKSVITHGARWARKKEIL